MLNALTRPPHLVLRCAAGVLFAGSLFAKDSPHRHGSNTDSRPLNKSFGPAIQIANWGTFGSPVAGTTESIPGYEGAELFAGPQKFSNSGDGDYFHGVLPNGRIAKPAGTSTQVGMNPLGIILTPDGKFAIVSNDDERKGDLVSLQNAKNHGGYSLSVLDTSTTPMTVVSQINSAKKLFMGLAATMNPDGTYMVYASGGGDNSIKLFSISSKGQISQADNPASIPISPCCLPIKVGSAITQSPVHSTSMPYRALPATRKGLFLVLELKSHFLPAVR